MNELKEHRARSIALQIVARNQVSVVADLIKHRDDLQTEIARLQPLAEIGEAYVECQQLFDDSTTPEQGLAWTDARNKLTRLAAAYRETQAREAAPE